MKVKITESDIKKMVAESVKKTILESMEKLELRDLVGNMNSKDVLPAFIDIYGQEASNALSSSMDMYGTMAQIINSGTPEQEQSFRQRISGEGWDVPDDMMYAINECVNRVVTKRLHK